MIELGWTRYDPSDITHYPITYLNINSQETEPMPWIKISRDKHKTTIHGSTGPFGPKFHKLLRARPYPLPNFNRTTSFRDDSIDLFDPTSYN